MNIAIICAMETPIPASRGGATETMMTHLIDVNEGKKKHKFHIFSYYDFEASVLSHKYKMTDFYYYHPNRFKERVEDLFWRVLRKVSREKIYLHSLFVKWCAKKILKSNIDIVILEGNCFQLEYMRSLLGKKKIILHMHIDRLNLELKACKNIIDKCDGVFAISEFCKKRMMEVVPSADNKIIVVKNTVDTDKFSRNGREETITQIRKKIGLKEGQLLISYCGRIDPTKGVLELVEAMASLADPNLRLMIIGSSIYAGSKKNAYMKKVEEKAKQVVGGVFFTGYVPQKELPNYVSGSDVATVPSLCLEAAGNVTIEALGCEVPVIASTQGGIPEYADKSACLLVNVDKDFIKNFASAIHKLAYDKDLYSSLKKNTREVAVKYNKYNYYMNFDQAINKIFDL